MSDSDYAYFAYAKVYILNFSHVTSGLTCYMVN